MTTNTLARPTAARTDLKVTFPRVMRSEWIKFWSLRSSIVTLAATVALFIGIGLLASSITGDGGGPGNDGPGGPTEISLAGTMLAQLVIGTLGVLFMAGEYSTGMIRSTLAAVPGRLAMLGAKIVVFAGITFTAMLVSAFVAFLGGQAILGDGANAALSDPGVVRAIFGAAAFLTGAGVLGLLLGALLRSTPAAISTFFGVMFLLEGIVMLLLPESWRDTFGPYLPSSVGNAMSAVADSPSLLSPGAGALVLASYLVVVGGFAAWRLKSKDA